MGGRSEGGPGWGKEKRRKIIDELRFAKGGRRNSIATCERARVCVCVCVCECVSV